MKSYLGILGILLCGLSSVSCADEEPSLEESVDALFDERKTQLQYICNNCDGGTDLAPQSACEGVAGYPGPGLRRCYVYAFERHEEAGLEWLQCMQPIMEEHTTCVELKLDCSNPSSLDGCQKDIDAGTVSCGKLPPAIFNALEDCEDV